MNAVILLGTLKKEGFSNTETLSEFFAEKLRAHDVACTIVKLVEYAIMPGTSMRMNGTDEWPKILEKILDAQIVVFATPIWWNSHSSQMQMVIERLDALHDEILAGKESRLARKAGGVIVTGDSDGAQHLIAGFLNFFNAIGLTVPPYASLTVLSEKQAKDAHTQRNELYAFYEQSYTETAETMARNLVQTARSMTVDTR